jgi:hypothetical protein
MQDHIHIVSEAHGRSSDWIRYMQRSHAAAHESDLLL